MSERPTDRKRWISTQVAGITVSAIKEMAMRGARVPDAASLAWGLPSFRTPQRILESVEHALEYDADVGKYSLPDGLPGLRAAVATKHERVTGIATDPDRNVFITCGNMQALNALFHVVLDPGDEIILTDPSRAGLSAILPQRVDRPASKEPNHRGAATMVRKRSHAVIER